MIEARVFIATSMDGFIARRDGDIEWLLSLPSDGGDYGYADFLKTVDGIIMGRGSFEKVLTFPEWIYPKPVIVLSQTLNENDLRADLVGKVTISDRQPAALMTELEAKGWMGAYIDGGKVIQSFLRAGLISDLIVSRIPVLLGDGIPLFGPLEQDIKLEHVETEAFASGLVQSRYKVIQ